MAEFFELDSESYIICEKHKSRPRKKIVICWNCNHRHKKCKKITKNVGKIGMRERYEFNK